MAMKRIALMFPEKLLEKVEAAIEKQYGGKGRVRSEFIVRAAVKEAETVLGGANNNDGCKQGQEASN